MDKNMAKHKYQSGNIVEFIPDEGSSSNRCFCVVCGTDDLYEQIRVYKIGSDTKHSQWVDDSLIHPVKIDSYWLEKIGFHLNDILYNNYLHYYYANVWINVIPEQANVSYNGELICFHNYIHQVQNLLTDLGFSDVVSNK